MTILVAGMGNVLRGDDGFGVEVARKLSEAGLGRGVVVQEFGINGIGMVQELMSGYDALIVVDLVPLRRAPGTLRLLAASVPSLSDLPRDVRGDFLADVHWAEPGRALVLAKALGVLPSRTWILGCEPESTEDLRIGLGSQVADAVPRAVDFVRGLIRRIEEGADVLGAPHLA